MRRRAWFAPIAAAALLGLTCFGDPDTLGLPRSEDAACIHEQVCGSAGVCVVPEADSQADEPTNDGATGDGDGDGDGGGAPSCTDCTFVLTDCCHGAGQDCGPLQGECCGGLTCNLVMTKCEWPWRRS